MTGWPNRERYRELAGEAVFLIPLPTPIGTRGLAPEQAIAPRDKEITMPPKTPPDQNRLSQIVADARRYRLAQEKTYREKALKLFPSICARCGREFSGKKLRELTVHHKDHNHDNNPPDGSNWELLCIYCHDNEHDRQAVAEAYHQGPSAEESPSSLDHKPFADLEKLLRKKERS